MKKRLKATAQRAARRDFIDEDAYDEEPNMRLSRAFFVVLVLHVVAVGGIFVFNKIQLGNKESAAVVVEAETPVQKAPAAPPTAVAATENQPAAANAGAGQRQHFLRSGEKLTDVSAQYGVKLPDLLAVNGLKSVTQAAVGQRLVIPAASTISNSPAANTSDIERLVGKPPVVPSAITQTAGAATVVAARPETYVVAKGDNPHAIARLYGVDYTELLKLNNISDPRLLQIGQVLKIPPKKQ